MTVITILANKDNRLYISMPHYAKSGDGERKDICYPTTKEFRGELEANILLALENLQQTKQNKYLVGDAQDMELPFTVAVAPFEKENNNIRGLARIYIADCFAVSNISLIMGKNGLFVSVLSYKTNQIGENNRSVYRDICFPVTAEFRGKLNALLTDAYERAVVEMQEQIRGQEEALCRHRISRIWICRPDNKVRSFNMPEPGCVCFPGSDAMMKGEMGLAEGRAISNDRRIVELLELLDKNQMNAQAEQVKQMCDYVGTLEKQINSMTEEIKSVRQELVSMKEDTIAKHVKDSLKKAADVLQKQCDSLKQQVTELKEKIFGRAGKLVDVAKRKGKRALYKITQVTGMRKKLDAIKNKVDRAIDSMENLEKAVEECQGQQEKGSRADGKAGSREKQIGNAVFFNKGHV